MDVETARLLFFVLLGAGAVVWLLALGTHLRAFRPHAPLHPEVLDEGEVNVGAPREVVRERLLASLRGIGPGGMGSLRLTAADERHIAGTLDLFLRGGSRGGFAFDVTLHDAGRGTRGAWRILGGPATGLRLASGLFVFVLSPLALATAAYVMHRWVLENEDPAVRVQVLQTLQVVHFLWPPFLFAFLRRRLARGAGTALANLLHNAGVG